MLMDVDRMILVSVDDHVVEPPDMFEGRVPARYRDLAPRVVTQPDGSQVWRYDGNDIPNIALAATAGRPQDEYGMDPTAFSEMRPGAYDIHARVKDMDANGVLGSMCFPSFPQFCGQLFARTKDPDLGRAMTQAYNDWHIDGWCGSYPGRFIPLALTGLTDPEFMAAEVRRVAAKGCHAVTFSENPAKLGLPSLHSRSWDPFWSACSDEGTIVCLHIGSSSSVPVTADDAPVDVGIALTPVNLMMAATDLLFSPVLRAFPDLRFALSEGGLGWIPYMLERIDYSWSQQHVWTGQDFGGRLPSEVFHERIVTCFIQDDFGVANRYAIGVDSITWECDFPHSDTTWPHSPEALAKALAGVPDDEVAKISHRNAMRHFRYDPFALRSEEGCTVGALRASAAGWNVGIRSMARDGGRRSSEPVPADWSKA
jgi:predicted TIM-barrel fold metal-dependent hydrolase